MSDDTQQDDRSLCVCRGKGCYRCSARYLPQRDKDSITPPPANPPSPSAEEIVDTIAGQWAKSLPLSEVERKVATTATNRALLAAYEDCARVEDQSTPEDLMKYISARIDALKQELE